MIFTLPASSTSLRPRWWLTLPVLGAAALVACGGSDDNDAGPPVATAAERCARLKVGTRINDATVTDVKFVAATAAAPEYCEVLGLLPTKTRFAVRLPSNWNHKTLYTGGGGFNGDLATASPASLALGLVTIASTGGNNKVRDGAFALDSTALNDYAYLSVPRTSAVAKTIITTVYQQSASRNYFEGCSNGGREGLMAAQRNPELFDGIVAKAPPANFTDTFFGFAHTRQMIAKPGGNLAPADLTLLNRAVLKACDGLDGLEDGIVGRPEACAFDPGVLACNGSNDGACLTATQLATVAALYQPLIDDGKPTALGFQLGAEANWDGAQTGIISATSPRFAGLLADQWVKYFVTQDPNFNIMDFNVERWQSRMGFLRTLLDTTNPDLSAFQARGGKLIMYHGMSDNAVSPRTSMAYYSEVVKKSGSQGAADSLVRLYLNPGVGHCTGGVGPDNVDLLGPLMAWVEKGTDPATSTIVASKLTDGKATMTRPLCVYPTYPRYKGAGDPNAASGFECANP